MNRRSTGKVFAGMVAGVMALAATAMAGGGNVLPSTASFKGFSLQQMAKATAVYNTGVTAGISEPAPNVPVQILVKDTRVPAGTGFYLPIFFDDDSGGTTAGFPTDVSDQSADAAFLLEFVNAAFGVERFIVQVDGQTTVLSPDYIAGVTTGSLPDGVPPGTHYIVAAAYLTPLTPGVHTVGFGGVIDGQPVVFLSYRVTVK